MPPSPRRVAEMESIGSVDVLGPDDADACLAIVAALPAWFGDADGLAQMRRSVRTDHGFVVRRDDGTLAGFLTMAHPFPQTWEIAWMAVAPLLHRQGVGRLFVEASTSYGRSMGGAGGLLVVKTLSAADPSPEYAATRAFYARLGFVPVAEVPEHWGPENPCVILARPL